MTKPEDFLGSLATLELPSGKIIYIESIGRYGTILTQVGDVAWTHYNPSTNAVIETVVHPAGTVTEPIVNSFLGKYDNIVYVEIDEADGTTWRAELNRQNFDDEALELLPSSDQEYEKAAQQSAEANSKPWYEKILPWMAGVGLIYVVAGRRRAA